MTKPTIPVQEGACPGNLGCPGCGANLVMRYLLKALGKNVILSIPACCYAVIPGYYPSTSLSVPTIFTAFEATGASISGLRAALDVKGVKDVTVVGFAGDGGTADIGLQALSGAAERGEDAIYVMYDNEAYMNTGIQRSSATPEGAWTTTTPGGKKQLWKREVKKNMMEIMIAHRVPYAASVSVGFPEDFIRKLQQANREKGLRFIHAFSPCPPGWRYDPAKTIEIARLAVETNVFPLFEVRHGKYIITRKGKGLPVEEYLRRQGRFSHLTAEDIQKIQRNVDVSWELLLKTSSVMTEEFY
ncbi:MAG: 3-methyl-2-oxobutanoate dehydrogenase subunit beta [Thermoplasmata archaeon]